MKTNELLNATWQCVHFVKELPRDMATFTGTVARFDGKSASDGTELLRRVADALKFPDYFGENWDALDECLRDLDWLSGSAYVLVVENARSLWRTTPEAAGALVESWLLAAEAWAASDVSFHLVFEL